MRKIRRFMRKIKRFLDNNKIFFETIVMVALTISGVFISISANSIMKRQAQLEEALAKPIINVEIVNDGTSNLIDMVNIVNDGSAIYDFKVEILPYFNVDGFRKEATQNSEGEYDYRSVGFLLPIHSLLELFNINRQTKRTGLLATITKNKLTDACIDDLSEFVRLDKADISPEFMLGHLSLEYFIRVQYVDVLGNSRTEVFQCVTGYGQQYSMSAIRFFKERSLISISQYSKDYEYFTQMYNDMSANEISSSTCYFFLYGESVETRFHQLEFALLGAYEKEKLRK